MTAKSVAPIAFAACPLGNLRESQQFSEISSKIDSQPNLPFRRSSTYKVVRAAGETRAYRSVVVNLSGHSLVIIGLAIDVKARTETADSGPKQRHEHECQHCRQLIVSEKGTALIVDEL